MAVATQNGPTSAPAAPAARGFHTVPNAAVTRALREIADALDIEGANPFRVRAYRTAARSIESLGEPVAEIAARGGKEALDAIPGVGESIAAKILEMLETGSLRQLRTVRKEVPHELAALLGLPGLGAKRVHLLHEELGVSGLDDLERVARTGEILAVRGFAEKSRQKLLREIAKYRGREVRFLLSEVEPYADAVREHLLQVRGVQRVEVAGSFRRRKETVGDLDILCSARDPGAALRAFTAFDAVDEVPAQGPTKASVRFGNGLQVDLRVIENAAFGAALRYLTGSKEHNVAVRGLARELGFKLSEYGIFQRGRRAGGSTEEEVFRLVGAAWIPPGW